jgi:YVTN family beta-propeller protein
LLTSFLLAALLGGAALAQHAQTSAVVQQPGNANRVWVCNKDNGTVSVIDVPSGLIVAEIPVGVHPRALAFDATGSRVFVANQRGNVPIDRNFVTPFNGTELRGTVSVINVGSLSVTNTLSNVGVEPVALTVSPNGQFLVVCGTRSATLKFYDANTLAPLFTFGYMHDLSKIPAPFTIADVDANRDGVADLGDPRGFVLRSDNSRLYVTHHKSPYVSVVDLTLNAGGLPTAATLTSKISTDDYAFDPVLNPVKVQILKSQGKPRFLESIALSPDGTRAVIPHVLHNVNHDVGHNFGPALDGAFANRVYPALTVIDAVANSYGQAGDNSLRLHNELSDSKTPAEFVPFGRGKRLANGNIPTLGGSGSPIPGQPITFVVSGMQPGQTAKLLLGQTQMNIALGSAGTLLVAPRVSINMTGNTATYTIPAALTNFVGIAQVLVSDPLTGEQALSTGLKFVTGATGVGVNKMGHRAGHPGSVAYSPTGSQVLMLNRGSEDLFLYKTNGNNMELQCVYPPRHKFQARAPFDLTTGIGDLPLSMTVVPDASTPQDDARVYIINEVSRSLSVLRVDWTTGTIHKLKEQIPTHQGADAHTQDQRIGQELFEDASRPQTTGNFNNSCASCHFDGGEDANVWQRPAGPRSTMPVYGGALGTGLILWKGVRLNLGETGPMFGGENGGTGIFTDAEQAGLRAYHEIIPFPLNPNLNPIGSAYTPQAALGKDLYFGTNDTGLNQTLRHAGCAVCHPDAETNPGNFPGPRFYTVDFLNPILTTGENLGTVDPSCFSLRENIVAVNIRNVNSGANVDLDGVPGADIDRNSDGFDDRETYSVMYPDGHDDFRRDDGNSYLCPCNPATDPNCDAQNPFTLFARAPQAFSVPQKLGVQGTGPYFHDHTSYSLRHLLDPQSQVSSPIYGSPAYTALGQAPYVSVQKHFNEVHDVRGHEQFVLGASKVQVTLVSGANVDNDIEAILAYISSL